MPSLSSNSGKPVRRRGFPICIVGLILSFAGMYPSAAVGKSAEHGTETSNTQTDQHEKSVGEQFCRNTANDASEARASWRNSLLEKTESQLLAKLAELKAEREAYTAQLDRYQSFLSSIESNVIEMYAKMRPEAAAQQLSLLDNNTAAAIMLRLKPRTASAILNEMVATRASELAALFASAIGPAKEKCQ